MQRWLHQHLFKVGWLITQDFQTTTILYYTLFLPGVILYEVVYWLAASILNVRAEGSLKWPEKQEIGELRLNFVRLAKKVNPFKLAIITSAPLVSGVTFIWLISNDVLDIRGTFEAAGAGSTSVDFIANIAGAIGALVAKPDFWIWFYVMFAIGNTLLPNSQALRGWRVLMPILIVSITVLVLLGAADEIFLAALTGPLAEGLLVLGTTLLTLLAADGVVIGILSLIENSIERVTGRSTTFKNGKMIAMTRAEVLAQREQQIRKERERIQRAKQAAAPKITAGPPSVYQLAFPIPGAPGQETVTPAAIRIETPQRPALPAAQMRSEDDPRAGASVITAAATTRPETSARQPQLERPMPDRSFLLNPGRSAPSADSNDDQGNEEEANGKELSEDVEADYEETDDSI